MKIREARQDVHFVDDRSLVLADERFDRPPVERRAVENGPC
jgi:hypothetical protein